MHAMQRRFLWVGSWFLLVSSILMGSVFIAPLASAKGEQFSYTDQTKNVIRITGGDTNSDVTIQREPGGNTYSGSQTGADSCVYNFKITTDGNAGGQLEVTPVPLPDSICGREYGGGAITIGGAGANPEQCKIGDVQGKIDQAKNKCIYEPTGPNKDQCPGGTNLIKGNPNTCEGNPSGEDGTEDDIQCSTGTAWSWIMCPMVEGLASFLQFIGERLGPLLQVNPITQQSGGGTIYQVWSGIRNIANLFLVFAMFALIFSQASSIGINAYGIKKLLPKIVVAAIAANLSFYICALAVDLSNVIGNGIIALFADAAKVKGQAAPGFFEAGGTFSAILAGAAGLIALGITGAVVIFGGISLVPIVVAVLVAFLTIAARQALIVILTVLAPVAFVLWTLPNTEKYFNQWKDLFINLMIMYPLIMVVFGGSAVASKLIASSSDSFFDLIVALLIAIIPLIALPALFKVAGYSLGKINSMANGYAKRAQDSSFMDMMRGRAANMRTWGKNADGTNIEANSRIGKYGRKLQRGIGGGAARAGTMRKRRQIRNEQKAYFAEQAQSAGAAEALSKAVSDMERPYGTLDENGKPIKNSSSVFDRIGMRSIKGVGGDRALTIAASRAELELLKQKREGSDIYASLLRAKGTDLKELGEIAEKSSNQTKVAGALSVVLTSGAGGTDQGREIINKVVRSGKAAERSTAEGVFEALQANQDHLDKVSPDLADFSRSNNAVSSLMAAGAAASTARRQAEASTIGDAAAKAKAGAAAAENAAAAFRNDKDTHGGLGEGYGFKGKASESILNYTPSAAANAIKSGGVNVARAEEMIASRNWNSAKPEVQTQIRIAAGHAVTMTEYVAAKEKLAKNGIDLVETGVKIGDPGDVAKERANNNREKGMHVKPQGDFEIIRPDHPSRKS